MIDWSKYPNFRASEFDCSHTGNNEMRVEFMEVLQRIREHYNRPMIITSGYRDPSHPTEKDKVRRGEHTYGCAVDVLIRGTEAMELMAIAHGMNIRRIGVQQKGNGRFIHIGMGDQLVGFPPALWSY